MTATPDDDTQRWREAARSTGALAELDRLVEQALDPGAGPEPT